MNEDKVNVKSSEAADMPKLQDENAIILKTPYYWSWYQTIFSRRTTRADDRPYATLKEMQ